ncbi:carboxylesterase/lipase family protein [Acidovorax sp. LjRoot38]|jgi:para-nitrobenzyl esterase|uniref:carboxylesterase/lipase family protein n=1 Tax=Acidovorax sp. LjRoot38 TaxID=3342327 RepID=UPI003F50BE64
MEQSSIQNKRARGAHPATRRKLVMGEVIGSMEPENIHAWRGIPYATAPVGALRWRAPRAAAPWQGVREALAHGPIAPQYAGLLAPLPKRIHGQIVGDEDCLHLNVFAPPWLPEEVPQGTERRPVMVWIHGGGNAVGTSASYDAIRNLAARDGLVVVTVNYRLGVLGWFRHPDLAEADDATQEERSGNFGTLDLILALQWVRQNIAAFGGEPDCVTIFGESAGGQNVLTLLASPLAAGLFHRAIAQSPVTETFSETQASYATNAPLESHRTSAREVENRLRRRFGGPAAGTARATADWLRSLTPNQLLSVFRPGTAGIYLAPRPVRDGVVLPREPLSEVFRSGRWNRVPVILGNNRDEYRTFLADKPEHVHLLPGGLPLLRDRAAYLTESGFLSQAWQAMHVDGSADAMLVGGHAQVWTYRFDWDEVLALPFVRPDLLLGAAHGMEMAFPFRDIAGELDVFKINTPFNRTARSALAHAMGDAWTSFARTGHPALPDGTAWLARTLDSGRSLIWDSPAAGGWRMAEVRQEIDQLKHALHTTPELQDGTARCRVYARTFLWNPLFAGHGDEAEYARWCTEFGCHLPATAFRPSVEV